MFLISLSVLRNWARNSASDREEQAFVPILFGFHARIPHTDSRFRKTLQIQGLMSVFFPSLVLFSSFFMRTNSGLTFRVGG